LLVENDSEVTVSVRNPSLVLRGTPSALGVALFLQCGGGCGAQSWRLFRGVRLDALKLGQERFAFFDGRRGDVGGDLLSSRSLGEMSQ